jgi:hypothetical protein
MKPPIRSRTAVEHSATAAAIATWPGDRPAMLRVLECRLLHRADWQYLGSRSDDQVGPWPIDSYRCERCERAWERVS